MVVVCLAGFEHFCSLLPGGSNPIMAVWSVFFDDSGTHKESSVAVAACFISDRRRWTAFDESWRNLLEEAGLPSFHMADFVARRGDFKDWSNEKAEGAFEQVKATIQKCAIQGYITAVVKDDYDRIIQGRLREKCGKFHYSFAVQSCLSYLETFRREYYLKADEPIQYVFDRMSQGQHEILDLFGDLLRYELGQHFGIENGGYSFQDKAKFLPLQSADIIAWEGYRYMVDSVIGDPPSRPNFQSRTGAAVRGRFYNAGSLFTFSAEVTPKYEALSWNAPRGAFFPL